MTTNDFDQALLVALRAKLFDLDYEWSASIHSGDKLRADEIHKKMSFIEEIVGYLHD